MITKKDVQGMDIGGSYETSERGDGQIAKLNASGGSTGAPLLSDGSVRIPATNYHNPFGIDLTDVRRRFIESNDRGFDETVETGRAVLGVRGDLPGWQWEVSLQDSHSTATQHDGAD